VGLRWSQPGGTSRFLARTFIVASAIGTGTEPPQHCIRCRQSVLVNRAGISNAQIARRLQSGRTSVCRIPG
jgi:hypothetical protein